MKDENYIYELVFTSLSNISRSGKKKDIKVKIIRIITKIIENIVNAEITNEDSEKFRRIKLSNPNISLMFEIQGNYEFIKALGFEEEYQGQTKCLYLPKKNINVRLYQQLLSYIELLILNFQENEEEQNYYEKNSLKKSSYSEDIFKKKFQPAEENNENAIGNYDCLENIEESEEIPIEKYNKNQESNEGLKFLKETGQQRYQNALKNNNKLDTNKNNFNTKDKNLKANIHGFGDYNNNTNNRNQLPYKNQEIPKKEMPKNEYNNNSNCSDEIGKKCLELTNEFRKKHHLKPLIWNDAMWKISLTHSKDMGNNKVPFGHKGFDERVNQFPFSYSLACENVFTCSGYRDSEIAKEGVKGWINSPGHRKNLLSNTTLCAIASFKNKNGAYYLTQMFAKKD